MAISVPSSSESKEPVIANARHSDPPVLLHVDRYMAESGVASAQSGPNVKIGRYEEEETDEGVHRRGRAMRPTKEAVSSQESTEQ